MTNGEQRFTLLAPILENEAGHVKSSFPAAAPKNPKAETHPGPDGRSAGPDGSSSQVPHKSSLAQCRCSTVCSHDEWRGSFEPTCSSVPGRRLTAVNSPGTGREARCFSPSVCRRNCASGRGICIPIPQYPTMYGCIWPTLEGFPDVNVVNAQCRQCGS